MTRFDKLSTFKINQFHSCDYGAYNLAARSKFTGTKYVTENLFLLEIGKETGV